MTNDTKLAIINGTHSVAASAVAAMDQAAQDAMLTDGGDVVLKTGTAPNGKACTVIARFAANAKCQGYFAIAADGKEQVVPVGHVEAIISKVN